MLTLKPDPSEVRTLVARMEAEIAEFVAALDDSAEMAPEDVREQTSYVAALKGGIERLNSEGGGWTVYTGEIPYVQTFMMGAADAALGAESWGALICYADFLRRLTDAS